MTWVYLAAASLAVALAGYLLTALLKPELFE